MNRAPWSTSGWKVFPGRDMRLGAETVEHPGKRAHKFPQLTLPFGLPLALAIVIMGNNGQA